jgi:hypothetical protein
VTLGGDEVVLLLNQARYLSLRHISEPEQNSLRLVVQEAIADRTETASSPDPASPFAEILKGATLPVKSTEGCRTFVLEWSRRVGHPQSSKNLLGWPTVCVFCKGWAVLPFGLRCWRRRPCPRVDLHKSFASIVEAPTAPRPVAGVAYEFFPHRIGVHIMEFLDYLGTGGPQVKFEKGFGCPVLEF